MKTSGLALSYPGFFVAEQIENAVILRFSGNFFHNSIDFDKKDFFSGYLEKLKRAEDVNAVILHSAYKETGEDEYVKFFFAGISPKVSVAFRFFEFHGHQ